MNRFDAGLRVGLWQYGEWLADQGVIMPPNSADLRSPQELANEFMDVFGSAV